MKTFYEIINEWIESRPKSKKVHDLSDKDIAELKQELNANKIWVN